MLGLFVFPFANVMVCSDINENRLLLVTAFAIWAVWRQPEPPDVDDSGVAAPVRAPSTMTGKAQSA
ncbi:hypothetical protein [Microbacterium paraoxydans]|uniref:hypothetical protein n=1 Tax=Microbacterium paraoxydans TaxID=199592 RepID=UPI0030136980